MSIDIVSEFATFLTDFLPGDYAARYAEYRADESLRREYQIAAFDAGWLMPDWEPELGGRDLAPADALAIRLEGARRHAPRILNIQGAGVVAPGLRQFGTPEQKRQLLRPVLRGEQWWALGMSEPGSGSDLASLRTTARRDGDHFVVNGQKIWTTQAHQSRWCTLYVRTEPDVPIHAGISCLILDLTSPGVDIRPIRRAAESVDAFCEVFLDDVRVPVQNLLGPLNEGWRVASQSLEHERDMIWIYNWIDTERVLDPIVSIAPEGSEAAVRTGRLLADAAAIRFTGLRTVLGRTNGSPIPEFFILKLLGSETVQRATQLAMDLRGLQALTDAGLFEDRVESLGATIYGGTSEIQRNLIAEKVLGLPKERR